MEDVLFELIRVLPRNGEWRFEGQREQWLHAAGLLIDLVLDKRKQIAKSERIEVRDIGPCGMKISEYSAIND